MLPKTMKAEAEIAADFSRDPQVKKLAKIVAELCDGYSALEKRLKAAEDVGKRMKLN